MSPTKSEAQTPVTLHFGGWHSATYQFSNSWQGYLTQPSYPQLDTPSARSPAIRSLNARMLNRLDLAIAKSLAQQLQRQRSQLLWDQSRLPYKQLNQLLRMSATMMREVPSLVPFLAFLLDFASGFLACLDFRIRQSAA